MFNLNKAVVENWCTAQWNEKSKVEHRNPQDYGMPFEKHFCEALDGCKIAMWYIPAKNPNSKKLAIVGHQSWSPGNKSGMEDEYMFASCLRLGSTKQIAIDYVKLHKLLHDNDYHVVAYDLRNHGESEVRLPAGIGEVEFLDAAGVMKWIGAHPTLQTCDIALMPFCASGGAFLKANALYPELFGKVKCMLTTNLMEGHRMIAERFHLFVNEEKMDAEFERYRLECKARGDAGEPGFMTWDKHMKLGLSRISAKPWVGEFKKPVLWIDPLHDNGDLHARQVEVFELFGGPKEQNEFHFIGTDQPGIYKTETDNRCEGYNWYQNQGSRKCLEFLAKHMG